MIKTIKYNFTPKEKARMVRRRKESREITNKIEEQCQSIFQCTPSIHRWTKKFGNKVIIGYGLFGSKDSKYDDNLSLSKKIYTLSDAELKNVLTNIYNSINLDRPFRIKVMFDDEYECYQIRFYFAEENDKPVEPLGKKIDIVHMCEPEVLVNYLEF